MEYMMVLAWGIFVTVFWMGVGWRAMRAHESLAASVDEWKRYDLLLREGDSKR